MSPILTTTYMDEQMAGDISQAPAIPQAEYHYDEASGTALVDHSGNGYNGLLGGGLGGVYAPAWANNGLQWSGVQQVGIPTAALQGAQTVIAVVGPTLGNQSDYLSVVTGFSPVDGQLNFAFSPGDNRPIWGYNDLYGAAAFGSGQPLTGLSGAVAWRLDGTVFVRGVRVPWYCHPPHGIPPLPAPNYNAAMIGAFTTGVNAPFRGTMWALATYASLLTDFQVAQETARLEAIATGRGVVLSSSTALPNPLVAFVGDSQTLGNVASAAHLRYAQATLVLLSNPVNFVEFAWGGATSAEVLAAAPAQLDPILATHSGVSVVVIMAGTNENWSGTNANYASFYAARKAAGWTYVVGCPGLPRFAADGPRAAFNAALLGAIGTQADAVPRFDTDPNWGQAGQYANATYYPDHLHQSTLTHGQMAVYLQTALATIGVV
jgi:hypothetical protein